jgi:hypothetical protein
MQIVTFYLVLAFSLGSCEFLLDERFRDAKPAWENPRISDFVQKLDFGAFDGIGRAGKIIGGNPAKFKQFPHQALLFMNQGSAWYLCGGSFVRYNWILTVSFIQKITTLKKLIQIIPGSPLYLRIFKNSSLRRYNQLKNRTSSFWSRNHKPITSYLS